MDVLDHSEHHFLVFIDYNLGRNRDKKVLWVGSGVCFVLFFVFITKKSASGGECRALPE